MIRYALSRERGPGPWARTSAGSPFSRCRRNGWPSNTHPPPLGTGLKVVPGELPGVFRFELVAKWFGIVIVHEHDPAPTLKVVVSNKDHIVSLSMGEDTH